MDLPEEIPDIGSITLTPRKNPSFDPIQHGSFTSEDYFVFSRIDGRATVKELILETGLATPKAIEIMQKLRRTGAYLLPGERAAPPAGGALSTRTRRASAPPPNNNNASSRSARAPLAEPSGAIAMGTRLPGKPIDVPPPPPDLNPDEKAAMAEQVALSEDDKRELILLRRRVRSGNLFEILGVTESATKRDMKRAYFAISKRFHPDRYYGKDTGSFGPWLSEVFEASSKALDVLGDERKRDEYLARLRGATPAQVKQSFQTREDHAAELFERACGLEVAGKSVEALKLFAAVCRVHPTARYFKRAARCALHADQLSLAEEYAKKAAGLQPDDPSGARLLAAVFSAAGKLGEAEETLERALSLRPDNDILVHELEVDLDAVRKQIAKQS